MLNAMELLPILYGKDVIGDIDKEEIEREDRNKGGIAAADMLLDRIPRKHPHWYLEFIDALKGIGRDDIAADLEIPEVMKKKCEQSTDTESRQRRNSTNTTTNGETENTTKETIQSSSVIDATKSDEENDDHQHAPKPPPPSDFSQGPQRPQMPLPSIPILRTSVMDANKSDADNDYYDYALPPPPPSNFSQDPGRLPMPVIPILRTSVMDANERDTEYNDYQYALQPSPPSQFSKGPQRPPIPLPRTRLPVSTISNSINKLEIDSNSSNKIALRPVLPSCRPYKCRCPPQPTPPVPHPILETSFEDLSQPASLPNRPTMQSNGTSAHQELEDEIEKLQREKDSLEKELELMTTKDGLHEKINEELRKKKLLQISLRNKEKETEALQEALADDSTGDDYLPSSARHLSLLTAAKDIKTEASVTWPEQSVTPYVSDAGTFLGPTSIVKLYNAKQGLSKMEIQDKTYNDSAFYSDYIPMVE